jgi:hypothetical protein
MVRVIHVVGLPGAGKSTLILAMAESYQAHGLRCAGQDPDTFESRAEALASAPGADVYFIEYLDEARVEALPGELVIRMAREGSTVATRIHDKMTHQEIADSMTGLNTMGSEIYRRELARVQAERNRLRDECEKIGHIFGESLLMGIPRARACVVCAKSAPEAQVA